LQTARNSGGLHTGEIAGVCKLSKIMGVYKLKKINEGLQLSFQGLVKTTGNMLAKLVLPGENQTVGNTLNEG